jgi:Zn-dependent M28 family amino/carboxypeptidase
MLADTIGYNVIGELTGTEFPNQFITVGGHLDSWDPGEGAHDDGAGCVHTIEVLRALKSIGYRPKRTIRFVLFANEENGGREATNMQKKRRIKMNNIFLHWKVMKADLRPGIWLYHGER